MCTNRESVVCSLFHDALDLSTRFSLQMVTVGNVSVSFVSTWLFVVDGYDT